MFVPCLSRVMLSSKVSSSLTFRHCARAWKTCWGQNTLAYRVHSQMYTLLLHFKSQMRFFDCSKERNIGSPSFCQLDISSNAKRKIQPENRVTLKILWLLYFTVIVPRNPQWRRRISTVDLLVLISTYQLLLMLKHYFFQDSLN